MALVVGTDTYVSVADADLYVDSAFSSTDAKRIAWDALMLSDKEAYLRAACRAIDSLPLVGVYALEGQTLAFPRAIPTQPSGYPSIGGLIRDGWYVQTTVPNAVIWAQIEIAVQKAVGIPQRVSLQQEGVKSFSLGSLSENYGSGNRNPIPSTEAREFLKPFLAGAVRVV